MNEQQEFEETRPMMAVIPRKRAILLAMDLGGQMSLVGVAEQMKAAQKQHPSAVGLTLALALLNSEIAQLQAKTTRIVLTVAATTGMPIEDHAISSSIRDGEIIIEAIADLPQGAPK